MTMVPRIRHIDKLCASVIKRLRRRPVPGVVDEYLVRVLGEPLPRQSNQPHREIKAIERDSNTALASPAQHALQQITARTANIQECR